MSVYQVGECTCRVSEYLRVSFVTHADRTGIVASLYNWLQNHPSGDLTQFLEYEYETEGFGDEVMYVCTVKCERRDIG
jgi:hypothetical protein